MFEYYDSTERVKLLRVLLKSFSHFGDLPACPTSSVTPLRTGIAEEHRGVQHGSHQRHAPRDSQTAACKAHECSLLVTVLPSPLAPPRDGRLGWARPKTASPTCTPSARCPALPACSCIELTPSSAALRLFRMRPKLCQQALASSLVMFQLLPKADGGAQVINKEPGIPDTSTALTLGVQDCSAPGKGHRLGVCPGAGALS